MRFLVWRSVSPPDFLQYVGETSNPLELYTILQGLEQEEQFGIDLWLEYPVWPPLAYITYYAGPDEGPRVTLDPYPSQGPPSLKFFPVAGMTYPEIVRFILVLVQEVAAARGPPR